ncbi:imelysin family protein [Hymenobacter psoromatis]|uniref:imelysin family protein n=1 Tax=Hymenobacter psoromatis TaxID=1484116 RepID=UPI001CC0520A|nr:imelysin family protein [Hymenobacter psoromatis]
MSTSIKLTAAALLLLATACGKDIIEPQNATTGYSGYNATALLANEANTVILSNYQDVDTQAAALQAAIQAFAAAPTAATLDAARAAYRAARAPWESTEAFAFGPVSTQLLDDRIDTWPLNETDLAALLAGPTPLTTTYLRTLDGGLQGYHPIEFLLFGTNNDKPLGAFTARELEFLNASGQNLHQGTGQLLTAWQATGGRYANTLATAGPGNATYASQKAALQDLLGGMQDAIDELGNSKIERPVASGSPQYVEARYSDNSKAEFLKNVQGVESIYLGRYGANGPGNGIGLSDLVKQRNPNADTKLKAQFVAAENAIQAIPGTFDQAITQNTQAVRNAQAAVRACQVLIDGAVATAVNGL